MEQEYTQAIDLDNYKKSGDNLSILMVSKKEGINEIPLSQYNDSRLYIGRNTDKCDIVLDSSVV